MVATPEEEGSYDDRSRIVTVSQMTGFTIRHSVRLISDMAVKVRSLSKSEEPKRYHRQSEILCTSNKTKAL